MTLRRLAPFVLLLAFTAPVSAQEAPPLTGHVCGDFDASIWAQSVYDANPSGNPGLDADGDGVACPELPDGFAPALWTTTIPANAVPAELVRVVDGDTIEARIDGQIEDVRLILIDTPETKDPNSPVECFGAEATAFTTELLTGFQGQLYLEPDVSDRDQYGRLLRYAWLDLGDDWRVNGAAVAPAVYQVNEAIARAGFASLSTYPPDVKYLDEIRDASTFAREHQLGLWPVCGGTDTPLIQRAAPPAAAPIFEPAAAAPSGAFGIAGNQDGGCDSSYPDLCLPAGSPDLDCGDVDAGRFTVLAPDPHGFDGDFDGVGCERN